VTENIILAGYRIERKYYQDTGWEVQAILSPASDSYTDSLFADMDYLIYNYRVTTLGASGQVYTTTTYCTAYFRNYPAPESISITHPSDGFILLQWQPVTQTLSEFSDTPDYYLITKSSSPDFSSSDTQSFEVLATEYNDPPPILPAWQQKCFYKVTAMALAIQSRAGKSAVLH
jgi:hypothetical protein